jgi:sugar fermentation stimulation protein A
VALSRSDNPKRKYPYTWELVHNGTCWICVNTTRANQVVAEAIEKEEIPDFSKYNALAREKQFGESRFDLLLKQNDSRCYIEIKSVTLIDKDGYYAFPDAPTARGQKHLNELVRVVKAGHRAVMLFLILRSDGKKFRIAEEIDPKYFQSLEAATIAGVEVAIWRAEVSPSGIQVKEKIAWR